MKWPAALSFLLFATLGNGIVWAREEQPSRELKDSNPPNILIFLADDLGHTQVGYHAEKVGNFEVRTPSIDSYAARGIEMDRGYMTPWCGPSRAAIQTGRTNSYNANVSTGIYTFDESIGYIAGLPADTRTIATALKEYGESIGKPYKTHYNGKWGIGGTAWVNTPMGMGYDDFRGFWTNGIDPCDGAVPVTATIPFIDIDRSKGFGPLLQYGVPGYWEQSPDFADNQWCDHMRSLSDDVLTPGEKFLACKTRPRSVTKHIDLDLVDNVVSQIRDHDFDKGPIFQFISTAMMHLPLSYPKEYDGMNPDLPQYFADGEEKPLPRNDDLRLGTMSALHFLDDVFKDTMKALQENPAIWNNTIVLFTSDNGGALYNGNANNNYPLRASKFSPLEGGVRIPQFFTGGWIENNIPSSDKAVSDTYFFPSDIAPTLLEMAGADPNFILEGKQGASYGNPMWEYIKASVNTATGTAGGHQKVRKVSYSPEIFFDVQSDRTMKNFFTGSTPQFLPRLWSPMFPGNDELLTDTQYFSVNPCRPSGAPSQCCYFNIEEDPTESQPLTTDCGALYQNGKELYVIEGGCSAENSTNYMCVDQNSIDTGDASDLSLWSQYGAMGPFTSKKGKPINSLPMKCLCRYINRLTSRDSIDFYTPSLSTYSECYSSRLFNKHLALAVPCDGTFAFEPEQERDRRKQMRAEGINVLAARSAQKKEQKRLAVFSVPELAKLSYSYISREGFTEWPNYGKFPYVIGKYDTCKEKGITSVPWPITSVPPFYFSSTDPTIPYRYRRGGILQRFGLCTQASLLAFFCPSKDNADLKPVDRWSYGRLRIYGVFQNGKKWRRMNPVKCLFRCKATPDGTAYIGDGDYGLSH